MANQHSHAFLDPLWRRILLVAVCAAWFLVELYFGNMMWVVLVGAATAYGAWTYLYQYEPSDPPPGGGA